MDLDLINVNKEESLRMASSYHALIQPKMCYDNVASIAINYPPIRLQYYGLKVAYGGVQVFPDDSLYAKHAFFIHNGVALDPTLGLTEIRDGIKYLPIHTMDFLDYLDYILEHKESLPVDMMSKLNSVSMELLDKGLHLIG